jgi:hypothetical protein
MPCADKDVRAAPIAVKDGEISEPKSATGSWMIDDQTDGAREASKYAKPT